MREQLIQYVQLLFAGAPESDEIKEEILQNTLDRYDDLIDQGKTPEAAYRLSIAGIGDVNEILSAPAQTEEAVSSPVPEESDSHVSRILRAVAIGIYILCPIPLIVLGSLDSDALSIIGLCGTLVMVAAATVLILLGKKRAQEKADSDPVPKNPQVERINNIIGIVILIAYFIVSFATSAWYITWVMFPISGALQGLVRAIFDLKEAQ